VDAAPQIDLEVDGIRFNIVDLLEILLKKHIVAGVQARAQTADQRRQRMDGLEIECLRVGQPPLVKTADQQGQTQGPRLVAGARLAPVETVRRHFAKHAHIRRRIDRRRLPEGTGKDILCHARRQPLRIGAGQSGELIGGNLGGCRHGESN